MTAIAPARSAASAISTSGRKRHTVTGLLVGARISPVRREQPGAGRRRSTVATSQAYDGMATPDSLPSDFPAEPLGAAEDEDIHRASRSADIRFQQAGSQPA
jgi:hypothetical protein